MIEKRPFDELGRFQNDWLNARYHFNFSSYHRPGNDGWGPLLVWNDDTIKAHKGFDFHGHRDMEIITYLRKGAITHRDHLGNHGRIKTGQVQVMRAGKGIMHSEHNEEAEDTLLYQIWIAPRTPGLAPGWAEKSFPKQTGGGLVALASGQGHAGALEIDQDATLYGAKLAKGESHSHGLGIERKAYLVVSEGEIEVNGRTLSARDGAAIKGEDALFIKAVKDSEILLADLP